MLRIGSSFCFAAFLAQAVVASSLSSKSPSNLDYANVPISFEANIGQADPSVAFLAHSRGGSLLLSPAEALLAIPNHAGIGNPGILRLRLFGANSDAVLEGLGKLPGTANYFTGADPSQWHTNVTTFSRVKYHNVYAGVDLIYYGNQQKLEYDFVVQPETDPNIITLEFPGAENITLGADGDLLLQIGDGTVREHRPIVYQEVDGTRRMLAGEYVIHSSMQVGFLLGEYDKTRPLIIDPVLALSSTFGGSALNQALSIAVDTNDNIYVTGNTTSGDFPTTNAVQTAKRGSESAFIVKFDPNGAVVYSTFLGGGVTNDQTTTSTSGQGIAVDTNGDAFVTGFTTSTNFPTKNPIQSTKAAAGFTSQNAFVTELNPAGNALVYSTYLGGSASDAATGIAVDTNGSAIITGLATSTNFPTTNAAQAVFGGGSGDAFVSKLSPDGSTLLYSTYLGGSSGENRDLTATGQPPLGAVAVDFAGNAYVTGATYSTNFPVLNAFQPANPTLAPGSVSAVFVTKLDPSGSLVYSTYFGGMLGDLGRAIGVDFEQNVYFAGNSRSGDLPTTNAFQPSYAGHGAGTSPTGDAFIAAFDATGTNLIYCTYLGGSGDDQINGIAVRPDDGEVAVVGYTDSPNFPLMNPVQSTGYQGIFKSKNGGTSFGLSNSGLTSAIIYSIRIDPSNPQTIYALTRSGCFKSTDGGAHWVFANNGLVGFSPPLFGGSTASLLVMDPVHPTTLYAATFYGVYKTTNGAAAWTPATNGFSSFPSLQCMTVDPTTPTTLYAGSESHGVYKSTDGGNTWAAMNTGLTSLNISALLVDPQNSSNVYAGADVFSFSSLLFKSTNGGANWSLLHGGISGGDVDILVAGPGNPATIYAVIGDNGGFPPSPVLDASTNGGATWSPLLQGAGFQFTAFALGPPAQPALSIATSGGSDVVSWPVSFAGFALQSTPLLNPANWQNVPQSPVTTNGKNVVTVPMSGSQGYYRLLLTNPPSSRLAFEIGGGGSPTPAPLTPGAASLPMTLILGTDQTSGQGLLECTDGGHTWIPIGLPGDTINTVAPDPVDPRICYAGLNGGRDCFIATFTHECQPVSCTYSGGSGADQGNAVATDGATSVYVACSTQSSDFPVTGIVSPLLLPNDIISAFAAQIGSAVVQEQKGAFFCEESRTHTNIFTYHNGTRGNSLLTLRIGTTIVGSNDVPEGLSVSVVDVGGGYAGIHVSGTTEPGQYTFSVSFQFIDENGNICTWTDTYTIAVQVDL